MRNAGAVIVDPANVETAGKFGVCEVTIFLYELKADLLTYPQQRSSSGPQSLKDLIAFGEKHRKRRTSAARGLCYGMVRIGYISPGTMLGTQSE